jgi:ABC-type Na+ efflux pump permease subunit
VFALGLFVLNATTTESRTLNHLIPFVIVLVIHSTDWTRGRVLAFAAVALAWSKVWVLIGYTDRASSFGYMMQQGPWSSNSAYLVQSAAVVVTAGLLIAAWRSSTPPPPAR